MKLLYLHIGIHKTGTTALQNALRSNEKVLRNNDILFPEKGCTGKSNHSMLAWELFNKAKFNPKKGGMDDVIREIEQSGCRNTILSGEDFEFLFDIKQVEAVFKKLQGRFNVFIVVYLRRQDEILRSEFMQWIKTGLVDSDFFLFCQYYLHHPRFFYHNLLNRWSDVFGKEKIILRIYDKNKLRNQDIVHDFLHAIGHEKILDHLRFNDDKINFSPRQKNILAMLFVNRLYRIMECGRKNYQLSDILSEVDRFVNKNFKDNDRQYRPISREEADNILKYFEDSNQFIAKEYFRSTDNKLFSPVEERADTSFARLTRDEIDLLYAWFMKRYA